MATGLATSIFSKGAKDDYATLDAYKSSGKSVVNSLPVLPSDLSDIFKSVKFTDTPYNLLGSVDVLSASALSDQLKESAKGLGLKADSLTGGMVGKATTLLQSTKLSAQSMMCTVGEYSSKINVKDGMRMAKLATVLSQTKDLTGAVRVLNQSQNASILTSMIGEASDIGGGGVLTSLGKTIEENGILARVVKGSIPYVLNNSDVTLLREITNGAGGKVLNSLSPGFAKQFSSLYMPQNRYNLNYVQSYTTIFDSFDKIYDTWDKGSQNGESIGSILSTIAGTAAFRTMLGSGIAWILKSAADAEKKKRAQQQALARIYSQSTVSDQIKMYFPRTVMTGKYNRKSVKEETTDLRLLGRAINAALS